MQSEKFLTGSPKKAIDGFNTFYRLLLQLQLVECLAQSKYKGLQLAPDHFRSHWSVRFEIEEICGQARQPENKSDRNEKEASAHSCFYFGPIFASQLLFWDEGSSFFGSKLKMVVGHLLTIVFQMLLKSWQLRISSTWSSFRLELEGPGLMSGSHLQWCKPTMNSLPLLS